MENIEYQLIINGDLNKGRVLNKSEIMQVIWNNKISRHANRNITMLLFSFTSGMRVGEIDDLKVLDVLSENGGIKKKTLITGNKTGRKRWVYFNNRLLIEYLKLYLEDRKKRKWAVSTSEKHYDGLNADSHIFLSQNTEPFAKTNKWYTDEKGNTIRYRAATAIQNSLTEMIKRGLGPNSGATSQSGRRTYASMMLTKGVGIRTISLNLGHQSINQTAEYIVPNQKVAMQLGEDIAA